MTNRAAWRWDRQRVGTALLDLVVPQECAGCGLPGVAWCPGCAAATSPVRLLAPVPGVAAGEHAGPLGRAVVAFKDGGQRRLAAPLGRALARAVATAVLDHATIQRPSRPEGGPVWLVPVPSRREARRRRGADHMSVLAGQAARELRRMGWEAHRCRVLSHAASSQDQVGLDRAQRRANLAGTLRAVPPPPGIAVVVDDVTTTGATVEEAVRALRAAGVGTTAGALTPTPWPILVATITVATRVRGHASGAAEH